MTKVFKSIFTVEVLHVAPSIMDLDLQEILNAEDLSIHFEAISEEPLELEDLQSECDKHGTDIAFFKGETYE